MMVVATSSAFLGKFIPRGASFPDQVQVQAMFFGPTIDPSHLIVVGVSMAVIVIALWVRLLLFFVNLLSLLGLVILISLPFIVLVTDKILVLMFVLPHGLLSDQVLRTDRGHRRILSPQDQLPSSQPV
jgi:hypothetical protein